MNTASLVLAIGAAVTLFGGIIQLIIAVIELNKHTAKSGQKKKWSAVILICIALAGAFGYASYASVPKLNASSSTSNPTATSAPQSSPTATSTSQVASGVTPTALAADGTLNVNKLLTCSTCSGGNDPIHFTINSVTIDNANGRTVWNATLNNVSGSTYAVTNSGITLQISSGTTQPVQSTGYSSTYMNAGDKATIQFTFAFVPYKGEQYTLTAHLNTSDASTNMPFDPINFTFPTATSTSQVTSDVTPTPLTTDGTLTENKLLSCSTCNGGNDPIHFTINSVTIDNANGRTVWSATLNNVSGNTYAVTNSGITLQISSGTTQPVRSTGYSSTYMNAGDKATIQFIFAFVPYRGEQYTFTAHLNTSDGSTNMPFDPVNFTF